MAATIRVCHELEQEGRFTEARAILGRVPDGGSKDLQNRIKLAQAELEVAAQLDEIRMSRGKFTQGGGIDYAEPSRMYAAAFRRAGIGSPGDDVSPVAERIQTLDGASRLGVRVRRLGDLRGGPASRLDSLSRAPGRPRSMA